MPNTKSRDGRFIISAPEESKRAGPTFLPLTEEDKETNVCLQAVENREISLADVANAICFDCFYSDGLGLKLLSKILNVHVTVGEKEYEFRVGKCHSHTDYLICIASQLKL